MKKLSILLCLLASALSSCEPVLAQSNVIRTAQWDYPSTNLDGLSFTIYHTTNAALPLTNWTVLTNLVATNLTIVIGASSTITNGYTFTTQLQMQAQAEFYTITASNLWGVIPAIGPTATPDFIPPQKIKLK